MKPETINFSRYLALQNYSKHYIDCLSYLFEKFHGKYELQITQPNIDEFLSKHRNHMARRMLQKLKLYIKHSKRGHVEQGCSIPKIKGKKKEKDLLEISLSKQEYDAILNKIDKLEWEIIWRLGFEGGLRASEIAQIKKGDIDWENNTIKGRGKFGKVFTILLLDETKQKLKEYISKLPFERVYLFVNQFGSPANRQYIYYSIIRICKKQDIKRKLHPHMLRHTLGRYLREMRMDLNDIKDYLRHSRLETTIIYTQVDKGIVRERIKNVLQK